MITSSHRAENERPVEASSGASGLLCGRRRSLEGMHDLPAGRFAAWATAWLAGRVSYDDALDALLGESAHRVAGLPGSDEAVPLGWALTALRGAGFEPYDGENAWNAPRSFVRDPAGHLVEVMSAPPHPPW
jgi:hypothetical protein